MNSELSGYRKLKRKCKGNVIKRNVGTEGRHWARRSPHRHWGAGRTERPGAAGRRTGRASSGEPVAGGGTLRSQWPPPGRLPPVPPSARMAQHAP